MDADAQGQLASEIEALVGSFDARLERQRAFDCIRGARKLHQHAIAQKFDDAAMSRGQFLVGHRGHERAPPGDRAVRVALDEGDGVDNVDEHHRGQAPRDAG